MSLHLSMIIKNLSILLGILSTIIRSPTKNHIEPKLLTYGAKKSSI
jgi:hypothetical protein